MDFGDLNLIASVHRAPPNAVSKRRQRLFIQLNKQIDYAQKYILGGSQRGRWFRQDCDGSFSLAIRYGQKDLELAEGKFGISCASIEELIKALSKARLHCSSGLFDAQLEKISREVRRNFQSEPAQKSLRGRS